MRPLCFVLMPFGTKRHPGGGPDIDFDAIYERGIRPGLEAANLEPIRADEERTGGITHKAMFERLLLCDFAIADVTTGSPKGDPQSLEKKKELLPVVRFAVTQRLRLAKADYWDCATLLELAVLAGDETSAREAASHAVAALREPWEAGTTANNLELILHARRARGVDETWLTRIIADLRSRSRP